MVLERLLRVATLPTKRPGPTRGVIRLSPRPTLAGPTTKGEAMGQTLSRGDSSEASKRCLEELAAYEALIEDANTAIDDLTLGVRHPLVLAMKRVAWPSNLRQVWLVLQRRAKGIQTYEKEGGKWNRRHDILGDIGELRAFLSTPTGEGNQQADDYPSPQYLVDIATAAEDSAVPAGSARSGKAESMAQEKASDCSSFEYAYGAALGCAHALWGIRVFSKLAGETGKEALPDGVALLDKVRRTVADGKRISPEVKRTLTEISGGTVRLASGPVDGTSAHDAALELGKHLLVLVGDGLSKDSKFYEPSVDSLSKKEKQALAACFVAPQWKNREVRGLAKRIEREYLLACQGNGAESAPKTLPRKRKRKRKPDAQTEKKRSKTKERQKREKEIFEDWHRQTWLGYQDYVRWKNENLPEGWSKLTRHQVERAIENVKRRARYQKK